MSFQSNFLIFALIVLILMLIFIGTMLVNPSESAQWPPVVGECPDYWVDSSYISKGDSQKPRGSSCLNSKSLGKCNIPSKGSPNTKDFNTTAFTGSNSTCAKYTWAKKCQVSWDGITSGIMNPCDTSIPESK
jgi:hypothetical protein